MRGFPKDSNCAICQNELWSLLCHPLWNKSSASWALLLWCCFCLLYDNALNISVMVNRPWDGNTEMTDYFTTKQKVKRTYILTCTYEYIRVCVHQQKRVHTSINSRHHCWCRCCSCCCCCWSYSFSLRCDTIFSGDMMFRFVQNQKRKKMMMTTSIQFCQR